MLINETKNTNLNLIKRRLQSLFLEVSTDGAADLKIFFSFNNASLWLLKLFGDHYSGALKKSVGHTGLE